MRRDQQAAGSPRRGIGVAAKFRGDAARIHGCRPDAGRPEASIQLDGEQDVGRLRAAVAHDGAVAGNEGRNRRDPAKPGPPDGWFPSLPGRASRLIPNSAP